MFEKINGILPLFKGFIRIGSWLPICVQNHEQAAAWTPASDMRMIAPALHQ